MKKAIPIFIIVIFIMGITSCKRAKDEHFGTLYLLSYNIAGLPEGLSGSHPLTYTSLIAPMLNEHGIVNLQEDFCYHDSVLKYSKFPFTTPTMGCVPDGDGLNTLSRYPITHLYREAWRNCTSTDCLTPKGFSYSNIELTPGVFIDVYNVHANSGSSDMAKEARRYNLNQLMTYIELHSKDRAVIVMGDFNSRYARIGDSIELMHTIGFHDVWLDLIRKGNIPEKGSNVANCSPDRNAYDCEKIDKVFYRSNSNVVFTPVSYQLDDTRYYFHQNDSFPLSDHWPLSVKLDYAIR